jgi:hypothetical protein
LFTIKLFTGVTPPLRAGGTAKLVSL